MDEVWDTFIERKDGVAYECDTCLDHGGVYLRGSMDSAGEPYSICCPSCKSLSIDD